MNALWTPMMIRLQTIKLASLEYNYIFLFMYISVFYCYIYIYLLKCIYV